MEKSPRVRSLYISNMRNCVYSDLDWEMKNPDGLVYDMDAIRQSVETILNTEVGERFFNPEFGSNFRKLLFESMDDITAKMIRGAVLSALGRWEPRIRIETSYVKPLYDDNKYEVFIHGDVVGLEEQRFGYRGYLVQGTRGPLVRA